MRAGFLACVLMTFLSSTFIWGYPANATAIVENGCVPYSTFNFQTLKPDVQIKETDNGKGEATILVPFVNEDRSWWEFWKPTYIYKEAKMPTKDLPKQTTRWWQFR